MRLNEYHLRRLARFCHLELSTGGPDPQVSIVAKTPAADEQEGAWLVGCFVAPYTVGGGAALWRGLRPSVTHEEALAFVAEHKRGIPMRRERRAVYANPKLATCLAAFGRWVTEELPRVDTGDYEALWRSLGDHATFFGRYANMKILETLHRRGLVAATMPDIRGRGAWSPRATVAMVHPDKLDLMKRGTGAAALAEVEAVSADLKLRIEGFLGREMSFFEYETLLCNYRQALAGKYPGRSHDRELAHWRRAETYWGALELNESVPFYALRRDLFPGDCLGEERGWHGAREDLEETFERKGFFWCDTTHTYHDGTMPAEGVRGRLAAYEVSPGLFMRGNLKGKPLAAKVRMLTEYQIDTVYCLLRTPDPDMRRLADEGWVNYEQEPLPDAARLKEKDFHRVSGDVAHRLARGERVLVHCVAGRNRSGLVAGLATWKRTGCSGHEALAAVRHARPSALVNRVYEGHLAGLAPCADTKPEPAEPQQVEMWA